jgi:hypothetical protein
VLRDGLQEIRELGLLGTAFRIGWEVRARTGLLEWPARSRVDSSPAYETAQDGLWADRLPFADPDSVAYAMRDRIQPDALARLRDIAQNSLRGRILCFGRWVGDFGDPIDWHRHPATGTKTSPNVHWARALRAAAGGGDVKLLWEAARFPHAYHVARAAAFFPEVGLELSRGLLAQIEQFVERNPEGRGVHWNSGQEISVRCLSWLFALDCLLLRHDVTRRAVDIIGTALLKQTQHVQKHISFARMAVNNNHVIAEALLLLVSGSLLAGHAPVRYLREQGYAILVEETERQFYQDGGYTNLSHNYHRGVLQYLLWAWRITQATGIQPSERWRAAMERSLVFLLAHMNTTDGRLPNYGANDGSCPSILSTCDHADFRPTLQAVSIACRSERVFEPGPWDEEAAWLFGPRSLDLPLRPPARRSISFADTGFHVLRSASDESTFAAFRCGSVRARFSQIDMLHVDVFWKGQNIFVDGGSYLYNGAVEWHDHFMETGSHNTVMVDGRDQMVHHRQFKCLYWTRARLMKFARQGEWQLATGEHYGFERHPGGCVHRRSIVFHDSGLAVIRDTVLGMGTHRIRLHWLAGPFPWSSQPEDSATTLQTDRGPFTIRFLRDTGEELTADAVVGRESPPRGWLSRYYAEKTETLSLVAELDASCPASLLTIFGPGQQTPKVTQNLIEIETESRTHQIALSGDWSLNPI